MHAATQVTVHVTIKAIISWHYRLNYLILLVVLWGTTCMKIGTPGFYFLFFLLWIWGPFCEFGNSQHNSYLKFSGCHEFLDGMYLIIQGKVSGYLDACSSQPILYTCNLLVAWQDLSQITLVEIPCLSFFMTLRMGWNLARQFPARA